MTAAQPTSPSTRSFPPALAVTNTVANSLAMGLATFFVLTGSSLLVSTFKNLIPKEVRIASFILAFASLPQEAGATNLVTWNFSGLVDESTVSDISVGTTCSTWSWVTFSRSFSALSRSSAEMSPSFSAVSSVLRASRTMLAQAGGNDD